MITHTDLNKLGGLLTRSLDFEYDKVFVFEDELIFKFKNEDIPIQMYDKLLNEGFSLKAYYLNHEAWMCGVYENGIYDEFDLEGPLPNGLSKFVEILVT